MNVNADSIWLDTILELSKIHEEGPAEKFSKAMEDLNGVIKECAVATSQFSYLRFEGNTDNQMKLSEIAAVFTPEGYTDMINDLISSPVLMMSSFLREVKSNEQLEEARKNPELVDKLMTAGMKALIIEIGENPGAEPEVAQNEQTELAQTKKSAAP